MLEVGEEDRVLEALEVLPFREPNPVSSLPRLSLPGELATTRKAGSDRTRGKSESSSMVRLAPEGQADALSELSGAGYGHHQDTHHATDIRPVGRTCEASKRA